MTEIKLRNGSSEQTSLVAVLFKVIEHLFLAHPVCVLELVRLARDPSHAIHGGWEGESATELVELGLISICNGNATMHASTRNIVTSMFEGDGLELTLVNPRMP